MCKLDNNWKKETLHFLNNLEGLPKPAQHSVVSMQIGSNTVKILLQIFF